MIEMKLVNAPKPKPRGLSGLLVKWGGFVKFSHTLFAMPFALASMMVASREHYFYMEVPRTGCLNWRFGSVFPA